MYNVVGDTANASSCERHEVSLIAKMRMSLDGRGSHSFAELKRTGERLCDASTLSFCIICVALLRGHIEPLANLMQDVDALAWERLDALKKFCNVTAAQLLGELKSARQFLSLGLLLRPYLPRRDFGCFWLAHIISQRARWFSGLWSNMHELVCNGCFRGCDLIIAPLTQAFCHPTCQCYARRAVPGTTGLARGGGVLHPQGLVASNVRGHECWIPSMAKRSCPHCIVGEV